MEEIKINIMYQYTPYLKGKCENISFEVPKDSRNRDTRWLLKEVNFSVRGENHKPCGFQFAVCKKIPAVKNVRNESFKPIQKSEIFTIPYSINHHTIEYENHFVIKSGLYIVPIILEIGQNSEKWSIYLKLQEHYDTNGCCADKMPFQKISKYSGFSFIDNIVVVEDL